MKGKARTKRAPAKRPYDTSGRQAEAQRTRTRIVDAATEMVKEGIRPELLSYAEVASRSGVAGRTVYRHFPRTEDLVVAVATAVLARFTGGELAVDRPAVALQLERFHEVMCADPKLFRVLSDTPLRSEMGYGDYLRGVFADELEKLPAERHDAVLATLEALGNPYAWDVMHRYWNLSREQITRTCLAAMQAVLDRFQREPALLDPSSPLPPLFRAAAAADGKAKRKKEGTSR